MAGDSVLASFRTATGAVAAALAAQAELNARGQAMPEDARVRYRIGIHLGDVIEKADGSVYGDGVNIAARLQSMADHGGITVSGMVHEAVRNRLTATFEDQGDQQVKNIPHPVRAYRIQVDGSIRGESTAPTMGIDELLGQREQLKELLKQKFKRRLTIVFTDLKGSTEIAEREGDLASRAMLKRYHDLVQETIKENGGVFVKTIGDGTLSHFTEAQSALRAAAVVQRKLDEANLAAKTDAVLLARIGMHTGDCYVEKDDIFGDVVNTASRVEGSASAGEILMSEDTYRALADKSEIYCRFYKELTLKGKSEPLNAYKAFWDPKEVELDKSPPVAAPERKAWNWRLTLLISVPLLAVLAISLFAGGLGKVDQGAKRSVQHSLPPKQ